MGEARVGDDLQDQIELLIKGHSAREQLNALGSALARAIAADHMATGSNRGAACIAAVNVGHSMANEIAQGWGKPIETAPRKGARQ